MLKSFICHLGVIPDSTVGAKSGFSKLILETPVRYKNVVSRKS